MSWNVQGLYLKLRQYDFIQFCKQFDIFSLSEINNCSQQYIEEKFPEYDIYISKREHFKGGGLAVFVLKTIKQFVSKIEIDMNECIVLNLKKDILRFDEDIICCFPYIAHEYSILFNDSIKKGMEILIDLHNLLNLTHCQKYWIIAGDLNARTGNLIDFIQSHNLQLYLDAVNGADDIFDDIQCSRRNTRDASFTNLYGRQLIEFCKNTSMLILNGRTEGDMKGNITCIANKGKTIVDYFLISKSIFHFVKCFKIVPRSESDHFPLTMSLDCTDTLENSISNNLENVHDNILYNKLSWQSSLANEYGHNLNINLESNYNNFQSFINDNDINAANEIITNCITNSSKHMQVKHTQAKSSLIKQPKWWDETLKNLKHMKYKNLHTFHNTNDTNDLEVYLQSKRVFKNACKLKRKEYDIKNINELVVKAENKNSKLFWQHLKSMICTPVIRPTFFTSDEWYNNFENLYNPSSENDEIQTLEIPQIQDDLNDDIEEILNKPFSKDEIDSSLCKTKSGKAAGSDGIGPEFFKINNNLLKEYLLTLFNNIYNTNKYPTEWCKSLIFPLHKKGSVANIQNYRGIALLNVISKIFTRILFSRLTHWCDVTQNISESQAGGRSGYSTIDNIFCLQAVVQKYITKKRGRFYILFIDFSNAYVSVNRQKSQRENVKYVKVHTRKCISCS